MLDKVGIFVMVWRAVLETYKTFFGSRKEAQREREGVPRIPVLVKVSERFRQQTQRPVENNRDENLVEAFAFAFIGSLVVTLWVGLVFVVDPPPAFVDLSYGTVMVWVLGGAMFFATLTMLWERDRRPKTLVISGLKTAGSPLIVLVIGILSIVSILLFVKFW